MAEPEIRMTHRNRTVRLATLVSPQRNLLAHHRFENCVLQGPAVLMFTRDLVLHGNVWGGALDDVLMVFEKGTHVAGVIAVEECEFVRCEFQGVGFIVTPDGRAQFGEHTA